MPSSPVWSCGSLLNPNRRQFRRPFRADVPIISVNSFNLIGLHVVDYELCKWVDLGQNYFPFQWTRAPYGISSSSPLCCHFPLQSVPLWRNLILLYLSAIHALHIVTKCCLRTPFSGWNDLSLNSRRHLSTLASLTQLWRPTLRRIVLDAKDFW